MKQHLATAAIALVVLEPVSTGLGSDSFAMLWDGGAVHGLNGSGRAPRAWSAGVLDNWKAIPGAGWNSVTVPGVVASWNDLSSRFGALPFERLFEPAISWAGLARRGRTVGRAGRAIEGPARLCRNIPAVRPGTFGRREISQSGASEQPAGDRRNAGRVVLSRRACRCHDRAFAGE